MNFEITNLTFIAIPVIILLLFFAHKLSDKVARNKFERRNQYAVEMFDGYDSCKAITTKESRYLFLARILKFAAAILFVVCVLDCFGMLTYIQSPHQIFTK